MLIRVKVYIFFQRASIESFVALENSESDQLLKVQKVETHIFSAWMKPRNFRNEIGGEKIQVYTKIVHMELGSTYPNRQMFF